MAGSGALQGKVALVTGGGTGIGLGIAQAFVRAGAAVALSGRRLDKVEQAAAELCAAGGKAKAVAGDVSNRADCARMLAETEQAFGALHILVNNAGIAHFGNLEGTSDDELDAMIDINFKGAVYLSRLALPVLRKHKGDGEACILNVSSSATSIAVQNFCVYSAAKAGMNHLTKCMARDYGPEKIRVNAILPGAVDTPIFRTTMSEEEAQATLKNFAQLHPLQRVGQPADIADMAVYLCGPQASWITGALVSVDGGIGLG